MASPNTTEKLAELVHEDWMATKRSQGITSRLSESGEELMVPYEQLSEDAKDLDRNTVRAVQTAMAEAVPAWSRPHQGECDCNDCFETVVANATRRLFLGEEQQ